MKKALIILTLLISSLSYCASMPMAGPQQEAPLTAPSLAPEPIATPAPMALAPAAQAPTTLNQIPPATIPVAQAVPSALPSAQAPITSVPSAQTQQAPVQKTYEKEMAQIETSVQKIKATKEATKQILKDLDTQITNAQQQIAQAKKISFDILRSGTPQEAQDQFNKIQKLLTEMQNIQNSIQIDTSKKFNDNLADIKIQIALIETLLNTLQAQGAFTKTLPTATPTAVQKTPDQEKPLATKIADMFTNAFAYSIYGVKKAVNWVMEPPVNDKEDKKKSPDSTQPATAINPAAPITLPIAEGTAKNTLTTQIALLTKVTDALEQIKIDFELKFNTINEAINALYTRLEAIAPIAQRLKEQNKNAGAQDMSGKEIILHVVSKTIDLTIISVAAAKALIVKTYRKFFAPTIQTFTQDVSKKLETIDKEPNESKKSTDIKEQK